MINIPFVNYADLVSNINLSKKAEIFFLGFYEKEIESMELVERDSISFFYTVEEAEMSRNTGNESVFRILIRFSDLQKVLTAFGFQCRIRGDHFIYWKNGIDEIINLQPDGSKAKPYQPEPSGTASESENDPAD